MIEVLVHAPSALLPAHNPEERMMPILFFLFTYEGVECSQQPTFFSLKLLFGRLAVLRVRLEVPLVAPVVSDRDAKDVDAPNEKIELVTAGRRWRPRPEH